MHDLIVGGCFLLLVLVPCLVAVRSASKEGHSGNTGEHAVASPVIATKVNRPSRIRMAADAAFGKDDKTAATDPRPSRLHKVATALIYREAPKHIPMVAGDPGAPKQSIRALRAKHAAAAKAARS